MAPYSLCFIRLHRPSSFFIVNHLKWRVKMYWLYVTPKNFPIILNGICMNGHDDDEIDGIGTFYSLWVICTSHIITRQKRSSFMIKPWTFCKYNRRRQTLCDDECKLQLQQLVVHGHMPEHKWHLQLSCKYSILNLIGFTAVKIIKYHWLTSHRRSVALVVKPLVNALIVWHSNKFSQFSRLYLVLSSTQINDQMHDFRDVINFNKHPFVCCRFKMTINVIWLSRFLCVAKTPSTIVRTSFTMLNCTANIQLPGKYWMLSWISEICWRT